MKSRTLMCITAAVLFAALAIPVRIAGQEQGQGHHHYKLVDLGTFGGPQSSVFLPDDNFAPILNNQGTVVGSADTSTPDPFPSFCFNPIFFDCFVSHAFQWQDGVMTDLGALPGGASSASDWISANGLIAGWSENGLIDPSFSGFPNPDFPEVHAVLWRHGEVIDLGTLNGGHESVANAVNSRGQVVGAAANLIPDPSPLAASNFGWITQTRAFLWQSGVMHDLGTLGGTDAVALVVNERGQIAGDSYTNSAPSPYCAAATFGGFALTTGAFLWEDGKMKNLGNLGGTCTLAFDLNNRGQVVGLSTLAGDLAQHPFLWDRGVLTDLGALGGNTGNAIAINDAGEITGFAGDLVPLLVHAFLWKNGTMTDLGTVVGDSCSLGFSINARGQVVGVSAPCDFSQQRAFLSEGGGPPIDLNTLIPLGSALHLATPAVINDQGEIAGSGFLPNGDQHAFLLIPCDENEADTEGCGDANEDAPPVTASSASAVAHAPTAASPATLAPGELAARLRGRLARRYRRFGMPQPPPK